LPLSPFPATYPGRALAAVFNPRSLSANHSKRRVPIHPEINSRDFSPPLLSLSLSLSLSLFLSFRDFFILAVAQ